MINELIVNDNKISGDENLANEFNNYFSNIGSQLAENLSPSDLNPICYVTPGDSVFEFKTITRSEVENVLYGLKVRKGSGLDKISNKLLKAAGTSIVSSLVYIFNLALNTGTFPDDMKIAKITPIFKSGDKTDCGNYRPVSVISAVAKIFEKLFMDNYLVI